MESHRVVSRDQWIEKRKGLLAREKEFTRLRDQLSRERRELPWVRVDQEYVFEGANGKQTLAELFAARQQLIVYHLMFDPSWEEACSRCSFWADNFNGILVHLNQRDVSMAAISRAPFAKLAAFQKRMEWSFNWVSSSGSDFNRDYGVSFTPEQLGQGEVIYNYAPVKTSMTERPGISVFYKRRGRNDLPHLFVLCPWSRHVECRLPLPRPDAERTRRGGSAFPNGVGALS
jgi:predicted dithiol-disulfide oxidoreductase (DUF899 family)